MNKQRNYFKYDYGNFFTITNKYHVTLCVTISLCEFCTVNMGYNTCISALYSYNILPSNDYCKKKEYGNNFI